MEDGSYHRSSSDSEADPVSELSHSKRIQTKKTLPAKLRDNAMTEKELSCRKGQSKSI